MPARTNPNKNITLRPVRSSVLNATRAAVAQLERLFGLVEAPRPGVEQPIGRDADGGVACACITPRTVDDEAARGARAALVPVCDRRNLASVRAECARD